MHEQVFVFLRVTNDWWVLVSNTLSMLMPTGRYNSSGYKVCVCVLMSVLWQVVNFTNVFVHLYKFPHSHTDHRPDRQVLISCQGHQWCVLTVTVVMTESPALEQRGMLGLTQGPLSHHAVCLCFMCVCKSSDGRKWGSLSVSSLLVSQWICQGGKD